MMPEENQASSQVDKTAQPHQSRDAVSLMIVLSDVLRLPDECLGLSFVYLNRYRRFDQQHDNSPKLDEHMLALACLSLASKTTESQRRAREFLLPSWRLMHREKHAAELLAVPSATYDSLRATLVRTELIMLRVLKFELRVPTPFDFLSGYVAETMRDFNLDGGIPNATVTLDLRSQEYKEANRVVDIMSTGIARACSANAMATCKDYQLSNYFPAKTLAAACIYTVLRDRDLLLGADVKTWLRETISRTVDMEDFREAVARLDKQ